MRLSSYVNNLDEKKLELASTEYESTDTVQAILYKLANRLFSLPKHSLSIVVDEAEMIGNDDYRESLSATAFSDSRIRH